MASSSSTPRRPLPRRLLDALAEANAVPRHLRAGDEAAARAAVARLLAVLDAPA